MARIGDVIMVNSRCLTWDCQVEDRALYTSPSPAFQFLSLFSAPCIPLLPLSLLLLLPTRLCQFPKQPFFNPLPDPFLRIQGWLASLQEPLQLKTESQILFLFSFPVMISEPWHQYNNETLVGFHSSPRQEPCLWDFVCCYCYYIVGGAQPQAGSSEQTNNSEKQPQTNSICQIPVVKGG